MHSCSHGLFLLSHDLEQRPPSSDSSKQSYFSLQSKSNEIQEPDLHLKPSSQGTWLNLDDAIVLWSPVWHKVAFSSLWSPQSSVPSHIHNAEMHFLLLHSNKSGPEKRSHNIFCICCFREISLMILFQRKKWRLLLKLGAPASESYVDVLKYLITYIFTGTNPQIQLEEDYFVGKRK